MSDILLGAGNVPQQAFEQYNDPLGNKLVAINRDGTVFTQGIEFADGTSQTTAGGGGGVLKQAVVTLSAAQILSLSGAQNSVVVIPGVAGALLCPVSGLVEYQFVTTPYTLGDGGAWAFGNAFNQLNPNVFPTGLLDQTENTAYDLTGAFFSTGNLHSSAVVGSDVTLKNIQSLIISGGDGTLKFTINYIQYTLA